MLCLLFAEKLVTLTKRRQHFFLWASRCVVELKDNRKVICFSETQQYLFNLLFTGFGH